MALTGCSVLIDPLIWPVVGERISILFPVVATAIALSRNAGRILTSLPSLLAHAGDPVTVSNAIMLPAVSTTTIRDPDLPRKSSPETATAVENLTRPESKFNNRSVESETLSPGEVDLPVTTASPTFGIARLAAISPPNSVTHNTCPDFAEIALTFPPGSDKYMVPFVEAMACLTVFSK